MKELESLNSIFKNKIFKIPDYQRGYSWTSKQVKDFWEDLITLPQNRLHYTGVLSLKKINSSIWKSWNDEKWLIEERATKPFHVVDGQQRLTTFVIFIQAIIEIIKSLPKNKEKKASEIYLGSYSLESIKEEYLLVEKPPHKIIKTHKFSYEVDNPSFKFLKYRILGEQNSGTILETFYTLNLENTKNFFLENLRIYYKAYKDKGIELLFKKITQNLMFNVYEISDDFDVFVAFETMNNRGKKLSNLELLKNRLIYLTTLYDEKELDNEEKNSLRKKINDAWKEVYYQLGRNKTKPLNDDDFLNAHWIMYFQYSREKGSDYIKFLLDKHFIPQNIYEKTNISITSLQDFEEIYDVKLEEIEVNETSNKHFIQSKLTPKDIENYVNSLKSAAIHWYNSYNPLNNNNLSNNEQLWLDRLNRIGIIYFRPLVTVVLMKSNFTESDRVLLFKSIERFIFIAFRLSRSFSTYRNSEFYRATRMLRNDEISLQEIIDLLEERMNFSFYRPEDSEQDYFDYTFFMDFIDKKFRSQSSSGFYGWNGLRYFLYEYEMDKVLQRGNQKIDWKLFIKGVKDKVSIEHIYPQTPIHDYWVMQFKHFEDKELAYFSGTLGNLLPLSLSINSSLQNDSFHEKKNPKYDNSGKRIREGYLDGSHSEIEVSAYEEWNSKSILERGLKLLNFMEKRWNLKFENDVTKIELLFLSFTKNYSNN